MKEYKATHPDLDQDLVARVKANIDASETIQLCAQHQKSIVDDILTISKLDSNLLLITPVSVDPVKIMEQCLKMFKSEAQICDITMEFHIHSSFAEMKVSRVMLDSSRLLQVLINSSPTLSNLPNLNRKGQSMSLSQRIWTHLQKVSPAFSISRLRKKDQTSLLERTGALVKFCIFDGRYAILVVASPRTRERIYSLVSLRFLHAHMCNMVALVFSYSSRDN